MEYIKIPVKTSNNKILYTLVDGDYDGEYFSQFKWYLYGSNGYVKRRLGNTQSYLHKEVCKPPKGMWVDHINRNKLDNRSCNLRWVTPKENAHNKKQGNKIKKTTGKYRGVHRVGTKTKGDKVYDYNNKWQVLIQGKTLGTFTNEIEAARAYDKAAKDVYGELAILNFK